MCVYLKNMKIPYLLGRNSHFEVSNLKIVFIMQHAPRRYVFSYNCTIYVPLSYNYLDNKNIMNSQEFHLILLSVLLFMHDFSCGFHGQRSTFQNKDNPRFLCSMLCYCNNIRCSITLPW